MKTEEEKALDYFKNKLRQLVRSDEKPYQNKVIDYHVYAIRALKKQINDKRKENLYD